MKEYLLKPVKKDCMEIILNQINNSICWINKEKENYEMGFFINFKYENNKIPVLLTKYNIIDEYKGNTLNIFLNNKTKILKIGEKRYINKDYNIAIFEIYRDKNNDIQFLEIDDNLFKNNFETNYYNESIYIIQNNNKKDISISFGKIEGIVNEKINYSCYLNSNKNNLPIFDLTNNKIIGIHEKTSKYYNKGILLKKIIETFFNGYNIKKNEIDLIIKIDKNDINNKIYFIDNYNNNHDNLKELNKLNTELYIDNYNYEYNKYFEPKHEGIYNKF